MQCWYHIVRPWHSDTWYIVLQSTSKMPNVQTNMAKIGPKKQQHSSTMVLFCKWTYSQKVPTALFIYVTVHRVHSMFCHTHLPWIHIKQVYWIHFFFQAHLWSHFTTDINCNKAASSLVFLFMSWLPFRLRFLIAAAWH